MIKIVMGLKGTGKTKTLIEAVNNAAEVEHGNVVCIEKGDKLKFDISHKVRLVNSDEFDIKDFDMFYGFLCGLVAGNYDITHIFIDSVMKICGEDDLKAFDVFLDALKNIPNDVSVFMTVSRDVSEATDTVKRYM